MESTGPSRAHNRRPCVLLSLLLSFLAASLAPAAAVANDCIDNIAARAKSGKVQLTWDHVPGTTNYEVLRSNGAAAPFVNIADTQSTYSTFLDATVDVDALYYYRIDRDTATGATCSSDVIAVFVPAGRTRLAIVPDIVGQSQPAAEAAILAARLTVGTITPVTSAVIPAGQLISQDPPANSSVPRGYPVDFDVSIGAVNSAPFITSLPLTSATEGAQYSYDVDASDTDPGDILTYSLDSAPAGMGINSATGLIQWTPTGMQLGANPVTVRVVDGTTGFATQSFNIIVGAANGAPSIITVPLTSATEGALYSYDVDASDPNPGDILTFNLDTAPAGMSIDPSSGLIQWIPGAPQLGVNPVTVRVVDSNSGFATQSFNITVDSANAAPTINSVPPTVATEGEPYSYDVEATDPNIGDTLTFSLDVAPAGMSIDPVSGLVEWTPSIAQVGANSVSVRVIDGNGGFATQGYEISVAIGNEAPSITSLPVTSATEDAPYVYDVEATDSNAGDTLTFSLDMAPAGMSIDPVSGLVEWTPNATQIGTNAVTVRVIDGNGGFATQGFTVGVEVGNQAPSITSVPVTSATEGASYVYDVEATDPNVGDTLTFSLDIAPAGMGINPASGFIEWTPAANQVGPNAVTVRVIDGNGGFATQGYAINVEIGNTPPTIISTPPSTATADTLYSYDVEASDLDAGDVLDFSLDVAPAGMTIDPASGLIQWTPTALQVGINSVSARVADGNGGFATQSYNINVGNANNPPSITSVPLTSASEGALYSYDVEATDQDAGDVLTFSLDLAPAGMTINAVSGLIQWTPAALQVGSNAVTTRVVDDNGGFATQSYSINVSGANSPPSITSVPLTSASEGALYAYDVDATDPDLADVLTFSLDIGPAGMSIDAASGLIQWTPNSVQFGDHAVGVRVSDGKGGFATQNFLVSVSPVMDIEIITQLAPQIADPNEPINIMVLVNGAVNPVVTVIQNGVNLPVVNGIATFSAAAPGFYLLDINVDSADGRSAASTATARVRDASDNTPPTVSVLQPTGDSRLTTPTDIIGTVNDSNLFRYQMLLAPSGTNDFVEFDAATNTVVNGPLGTLDPSMSTNGLYQLKVAAEDLNGLTSEVLVDMQIDSDFKPGVVRLGFTDMIIPVAGIPVTISRTYDSRVKTGRDLGIGWSLDIRQGSYVNNREPGDGWDIQPGGGFLRPPCTISVEQKSHVTEIRLNERESYKFRTNANFSGFGSVISGGCLGNVTFSQTDGIPGATLVPLENSNVFFQNGSGVLTFDLGDPNFGDPWEPRRVRLTTGDGRTFDVHIDQGIQRFEDKNGDQLFVTNNGIVNASGVGAVFGRDGNGRITRITDPIGNFVRYDYDANGDLVGFINQLDETTVYEYFAAFPHHLSTILLPDGRLVSSFNYDADGRLAESCTETGCISASYDLVGRTQTNVDATGRSVTYVYDDEGNILSQTDDIGNTVSYVYDADGNVLQQIDPEGNITTQTWSPKGYLTSLTQPHEPGADPADFTTTYTFDASGNMLSNTAPSGAMLINTYDAAGNVMSMTDENGLVLSAFTYNGDGRRTSETDPFGTMTFGYNANGLIQTLTDDVGVSTTFTHDAAGYLRSFDRDGLAATLDYDALGRQSTFDYSDGMSFEYEYDFGSDWAAVEGSTLPRVDRAFTPRGAPASVMQADGGMVRWEYDAAGRVTAEIDALGGRTQFNYDLGGRLESETDQVGNTTTFERDNAGLILTSINGEGDRREFTYYPDGRQKTMTNGTGDTWSFDFTPTTATVTDPLTRVVITETNSQGLITRIINPDGTDREWTYLMPTQLLDGAEMPLSFTDEGGRQRLFSYDPFGLLTSATDLANVAATYDYGDDGISLIKDAENESIAFTYNASGDVDTVTFGDGSQKSITYLPSSDVETVSLGSGASRTIAYDAVGRIASDTRSTGEVFAFTWDMNGNLLTGTDSLGTATNTYFANGSLNSFTSSSGESLTYLYDQAGRVSRQTLGNIAGGTPATDFEYDGAGRIERIVDADAGVTTMTYDQVGRVETVELANGITTTYQYDLRDQVTMVTHENTAGSIISSVLYARRPGGEPEKITWHDGSFVDINYDAANRVTLEEFFDSSATLTRRIEYVYDLVGNRTSHVTDGVSTTYTYGPGHRLASASGGEPQAFTYDTDGRTAAVNRAGLSATLGYNFGGQLTSAILAADNLVYRYDGAGRRIAATDSSGTRRFLQMPSATGSLDQPQAIVDAGANLLQRFVYAGDQPIARTGGGDTRYYLTDALGSVIGITDDSGNLLGATKYDAFGNQIDTTGDMSMPATAGGDFRFHGQWQEMATGLYYLRARDYDPVTGRFLSPDPAEPDLFEPESLNRYLFANANPYLHSDPTGRFTMVSINISINVQSTLQSIAINIARDYLLDKARSVAGSLLVSALKNFTALSGFTPFGLVGVGNPLEAGRIWEQKVQNFICASVPDILREIVWFEPSIRGGRASSNGYGCPAGNGGFSPPGSARPDFMLSKTPPSELGDVGKRNIKAYAIGEIKWRLKTFYNSYINRGRQRNQFKQIAKFAEVRVYSRTAVFVALLDGTKRDEKTALTSLLTREAVRRKIVPIMVSAQ